MHLQSRPSADDPTLHDAGTMMALASAAYANIPLSLDASTSTTQPVLVISPAQRLTRGTAIARYLTKDVPVKSEFERAQIDEWLGVALRKLDLVSWLSVADVLQLSEDSSVSPREASNASASARGDLIANLTSMTETRLATCTFLVGERLSLADICVASYLVRPFSRALGPASRAGLVHTTRWLQTVLAQPCFAFLGGKFALCSSEPALPAKAIELSSSAAATAAASPGHFSRRRVRVKELLVEGKAAAGRSVLVCGWARTVRGSALDKPAFIELNDGSAHGNLQVVCVVEPRGLSREDMAAVLDAGGIGASFAIEGVVVESPAKGQPIELKATKATVLGRIPDAGTYPLAKTKTGHSVEYLRTIAHLRPRTNLISSVARVRHACAMATHHFFDRNGFLYVHTPILTAADCEGAGEMFQVTTLLKDLEPPPLTPAGKVDYKKDFFGKPTFLTVSGQLNVECYATALSDVYTFGPTFRAENSNTTRHLAEFWMIEPEMCFATLKDDMDLAEDFVKSVTRYVMRECAEDLAYFDEKVEPGLIKRLENVLEAPFVRLTYSEAMVILERDYASGKAQFEVEPSWGIDLGSEHERYITEQVYKRPVILTNYPANIKAFYMKRSVEDPRTVEAMDVLVPRIGELIGGSARETDYALLDARVKEHNLDVGWYMDLRKYGSVPHAGFGLGFERLILFVTGVTNIRDVIPFPRFPGNAEF